MFVQQIKFWSFFLQNVTIQLAAVCLVSDHLLVAVCLLVPIIYLERVSVSFTLLRQTTRLPWRRSMASAATSRRPRLDHLPSGTRAAGGTRLQATSRPRSGDRSSGTLTT